MNREDLYVLGSVQFESLQWVNVLLRFQELRNIYFNFKNKTLQNDLELAKANPSYAKSRVY